MKIEISEEKKLVLIWLCKDEDKAIAQPAIDKYRDTKYQVAVFRSGNNDLYDVTLSQLQHNKKKCAEAYNARFGLNQRFNDKQHT